MTMVISTNMSALNTTNQLNKNSSLMNSSLQKLSSGYSINSASDDAAGLAISETMRSQIQGLDQASSNSQDAISLAQTADGALDETTTILKRMRELAVKASSETLTDSNRESIQDEVDQLRQEIDRISNDTEFNTKKLLNGDCGSSTSVSGTNSAAIVATETTAGNDTTSGDYVVNYTKVATQATTGLTTSTTGINDGTADISDYAGTVKINGTTITIEDGDTVDGLIKKINNETSTTGITATLDNSDSSNCFIKLTASDYGSDSSITLTGTNATLRNVFNATTSTTETSVTSTGTDAAGLINGSVASASGNTLTAFGLTVTGNDESLSALGETAKSTEESAYVSLANTVSSSGSTNDKAALASYLSALTDSDNDAAVTKAYTAFTTALNGNISTSATGTAAKTNTVAATAGTLTAAATANASGGLSSLTASDTLTVTVDGNTATITGTELIATGLGTSSTASNMATSLNTLVNSKLGTSNVSYFGTDSAGTSLTLSSSSLGTGSSVAIATSGSNSGDIDTYFGFTSGQSNTGSAATTTTTAATAASVSGTAGVDNAIDLSDLDASTTLTVKIDSNTVILNASDLTKLDTETTDSGLVSALNSAINAKLGTNAVNYATYNSGTDHITFASSTTGADSKVEVTIGGTNDSSMSNVADALGLSAAKTTTAGSTAEKGDTYAALQDSIAASTSVAIETAQTTFDDAMEDSKTTAVTTAKANYDKSKIAATADVKVNADTNLTFQVGANSDQTMTLSISDMDSDALGVAGDSTDTGIDLSSADKATAAITTIDAAIKKVSAERSNLGAVQNSLSSNINNLDTESENLSSADSNIRDTDMASEMAEYTKLSVATQAATAMLAKANQQPQQVLSLLQG